MNFINRHRSKIIAVLCVTVILVLAFLYGGNTGEAPPVPDKGERAATMQNATPAPDKPPTDGQEATPTPAVTADIKEDREEKTDETETAPTPGATLPPEQGLYCTLSVRCDNAVGKAADSSAVIPADGTVFPETRVEFFEGESVFNVLLREMKKNRIHLEFVNVPIYNSTYIEGINNLYEFDCGELSGWMYRVNGWFPNYGCSQYKLADGDRVEWVYTCDLGRDVGGGYAERNGMKYE